MRWCCSCPCEQRGTQLQITRRQMGEVQCSRHFSSKFDCQRNQSLLTLQTKNCVGKWVDRFPHMIPIQSICRIISSSTHVRTCWCVCEDRFVSEDCKPEGSILFPFGNLLNEVYALGFWADMPIHCHCYTSLRWSRWLEVETSNWSLFYPFLSCEEWK